MLEPADYDDLPEDKDEAFLHLCDIAERRFKKRNDEILHMTNEEKDKERSILDDVYTNSLKGAAKALGIDELKKFWLNKLHRTDEVIEFRCALSSYIGSARVMKSRRDKKYSVKFDESAKEKLKFILAKMRKEIEKLETSADHKRRLLEKIQHLEAEIDRPRMRLALLGDLLVAAGGVAGEAATRAEPLFRAIERVAEIFHGAHREQQSRLPAPEEIKQIEPPTNSPTNGAVAS